MMDWTHVKRIAWKDYRRLFGLWVALVLIWGLGLGYALLSAFWLNMSTSRLPSVVTALDAILVTTVIYVLGWGAITYSAEYEERTYGFLRSLPLSPTSLFYGKLMWGVPSALLLMFVLSLLCVGFAMVHPSTLRPMSREWPEVVASTMTWVGLVPLAMASGLFWSMRLKRPLVSVGVAGLSMVITTYGCYAVFFLVTNTFYGTGWRWNSASDITCAVLLFAVAATLFVVDRSQVTSWLPTFCSVVGGVGVAPPILAMELSRRGTFEQSHPWLGRLIFIQDRFVGIASIGLVCFCAIVWAFRIPLGMWMPTLAGVLGTLAFRPEHDDHRFRFLSQIGVPAFPYWLSRLFVPAVASGIVAFQVLGIMSEQASRAGVVGVEEWNFGPYVAIAVIAFFSVGQFCSIAFASPVIAFGMSALAMTLCGVWLTICALIDLPYWLTLLPTLGLPLFASYLRVSRWFLDTGSWRQWVVPAIPMVALLVAIPAGTAFWRIHAIPRVRLPQPLAVRPQPTLEQLDGADTYRSLLREKFSLLVRTDAPAEWAERIESYVAQSPLIASRGGALTNEMAERQFVEQLVEATKKPAIFPREYADFDSKFDEPSLVAVAAMLKRARQLTEEGQIDEAFEYYKAGLRFGRQRNDGFSGFLGLIYGAAIETSVCRHLLPWAMHEDNSADSIESAAAFLEEFRYGRPAMSEPIVGAYHWYRDFLQDRATTDIPMPGREFWLYRYRALVPWEITRLHRYHDLVAVSAYNALGQLQGGQSWSNFNEQIRDVSESFPQAETTLFADQINTSMAYSAGEQAMHVENVRRGTIYQLVSIAYHKRNSEYPHHFEGIRFPIAGQSGREYSLPPDVYANLPRKMELGVCALRDEQQAACIKGQATNNGLHRSFTDIFGPERHFPLPDFDKWSNERYRQNFLPVTASYPTVNFEESEHAAAEDFPPPRFQTGDIAAPAMNGFGDEVDRVDQMEQLLSGLDPRSKVNALIYAVRQVLRSSDANGKRRVLVNLTDPQNVGDLLDDLLAVLDAESPALAAITARQILRAYHQLPKSQQQRLAERCSMSSSGVVGIPIRDAQTGHYYELVTGDAISVELGATPSQFSWQQAYEQASERTFRGMMGHLATISSRNEERFLAATFTGAGADAHDFLGGAQVFWVGGSDRDEEGVWRWMCGPEKGQVFWSDNAKVAGVYSNQFTGGNDDGFGTSVPQQEDYLAWRNLTIAMEFQQEPRTVWQPASVRSTIAQFIVEYSLPADRQPIRDSEAVEGDQPDAELPEGLSDEVQEELPDDLKRGANEKEQVLSDPEAANVSSSE